MNQSQELWWQQAKSDLEVFQILKAQGAAPCHLLHYLQMATEKIAKAYLWRSGSSPPRKHAGFVQFLRFLGQTKHSERERISQIFTFSRFKDFQNWIRAVLPIAYELERIAPALANDGPNSEYPWPHQTPHTAPVDYQFEVWKSLKQTSQGRSLVSVISSAVSQFSDYADA